ncbi:MAG: hypothetical protein K0R90_1763 [Oscillospiraceae bacterium]|jgi:stage III sporulation protein AH|nr:hypothetical protein [Oscillospiraceae bacterium]
MKFNAIVGKRQIILASLVLILGIAVYLNWQFAKTGEDFAVTNGLDTGKNYGDTQLVNNTASGSDYFAQAKLTRTKSRDEAKSTLTKMLQSSKLSDKEKAEATTKALDLAKQIDSEGKIENLIKAKGFTECVVYISEDKADVVVKTNGLSKTEAAQIKDIILSESKTNAENIRIVEVK